MFHRLIGFAVILAGLVSSVHAQVPQINSGMSVTGYISGSAQTQDWHYEATSSQELSVIVNRTSGDLDPLVMVLSPSGQQIASNDDRVEGLVLDSGIETLDFSETGTYTIRVGSYQGAGDYRLWLVPGSMHVWEAATFATDATRWTTAFSSPQNGQLVLNTQQLVGRSIYTSAEGIVPLTDFYLQAEFEWISAGNNSTLGLVVRATDTDASLPDGYYFLISPDQTWSVQKRQFGAFEELRAPIVSSELLASRMVLGVQAEETVLRFYINGTLMAEINDDNFATGTWGLYLQSEGIPGMASVDNLLLTVPQVASPLDYPPMLESWQSGRPADIAAELADQNIIPDDGQRTYTILETSYQGPPRQLRSYPQSPDGSSYTNLMAGVDVTLEDGDNLGCGLALRYVDSANQVVAYADLDSGVGLIDVQDGMLRHNTYDLLPNGDNTLASGTVRLTLIANEEWVTLYANGRYFATHFIPPRAGSVGATVLNYSTNTGHCTYSNLWIWN